MIEPTLEDDRGHTRALVARFCAALSGVESRVWASKGASPALIRAQGVRLHPWFHRRLRSAQLFFLLRRLVREGGRVFLPTAGRTAIVLADRALGASSRSGSVVLYVHWLRPTPRRLKSLARVANRRRRLRLLTTTPTVRDLLRQCGFEDVRHVPYPAELDVERSAPAPPFRYVLYAGAARRDKGFHRIVDVVGHLAREGRSLPVHVQIVGDYFGRLHEPVREDIRRLEETGYPHLRVERGSLDDQAFRAMFEGSICLQLYDPADFADRVSGITLDALAAGAPIVAHEGTWMARQVERFGAGRTVPPGDLAAAAAAAQAILEDYGRFSAAARRGAEELASLHHPRRLVESVLEPFGRASN